MSARDSDDTDFFDCVASTSVSCRYGLTRLECYNHDGKCREVSEEVCPSVLTDMFIIVKQCYNYLIATVKAKAKSLPLGS